MEMKIINILLIAMFFLLGGASNQLTFSILHQKHYHIVQRHALVSKHNKLVIYHNMRVFQSGHQKHLNHQEAIVETYDLKDMGLYFTLHLIVAGLEYNVNIDTGSSDFFIKGEQSAGVPSVKYSCLNCLKNNQKFTIGYLDGRLDTYLDNLYVQLGKHKFNEFLLVAYRADPNFQSAEGLVGLSFPQMATNPNPTFIQTLINNKIIDSYSFGVNLNFQQDNRSFFSLGKPNKDFYEGDLHTYKILPGFKYHINISGASIGDSIVFKINTALLDTGTTCISIPEIYSNDILKEFNKGGKNKCAFDLEQSAPQFSLLRCVVVNFESLPSVKIEIQNQVYQVDKDVYFQRCVKDGNVSLCDLGIQSVKYESKIFLGDQFFNRYYVFFDITKRQIGIAKNKEKLSYNNMYKPYSDLDDEDISFFSNLKR